MPQPKKMFEGIKWLKSWAVFTACLVPQVALTLAWTLVGQPQVNLNTEARPSTIIVECGGDSPAWSACNLTFLGVMAAGCLGLAAKAQKSPSTNKEAKFISFSMMTFFLVGLAFIPAYNSTEGKFKVATEIFAIIAISYCLLGCIFLPKCYSLLIKNKNIT